MESSIMDKMAEYKFLMFENDKNNCWLDASVSLIAYNSTMRKLVGGFPDSIVYKIISIHDTAMSILNDCTNTDIEDRIKKTRRKLLEIQTHTMKYLQQFLKYKFGEPDSAHCALLNLILKDQSNIKEHLNASWLWKKVCDNCNKKTRSSICTKPIITLSNVKTFQPECPTAKYTCSCKTEQEMTLIYKELPPCLIFHFEKGAGDGENLPLNFKIKDREYQLTGVIVMERSNDPFINHFITFIRDTSTNMWLDCNDLNTSIVSFSSIKPEWNLKDVYVCMFESFDNLGKVINELSADEDHIIENLDVEVIDLSDEDDVSENISNKTDAFEFPSNEKSSKTILKQISENIIAAIENTKDSNANKNGTTEHANKDATKDNSSLIEKNVEKLLNTNEITSNNKEKEVTEKIIDYRKVPISNLKVVPKKQSKPNTSDFKYSHLFDESVKKENKSKVLDDINTNFVNPLIMNESTDNVQNKCVAIKKENHTNKNEMNETKLLQSSKHSREQNMRSHLLDDDQTSRKPKSTPESANKVKTVHETNLQRYIKGETFQSRSMLQVHSDSGKEKIKKMSPKTENFINDIEKMRSMPKTPEKNCTQIKTGTDSENSPNDSISQIPNKNLNVRDLFGSDSEQSRDGDCYQTPRGTVTVSPVTPRESSVEESNSESPVIKIIRESSVGKVSNVNSPGSQTCDEDQEMEEEPLDENKLESRMKKVLLKRSGSTDVASTKRRAIEKKQLTNDDEITNVEVKRKSKSPTRIEKNRMPKSPKRVDKNKMPKSSKTEKKIKMPKSEKITGKSEHTSGKNIKGTKENGHKHHKSKRIKEELISHNNKTEKNRFIRGIKTDMEQSVEFLVDTLVDKTFTSFVDTLFSCR